MPINKDFANIDAAVIKLLGDVAENFFFYTVSLIQWGECVAKNLFTYAELQTADPEFVLHVQKLKPVIDREYIADLARAVRS